MAKVLVVSTSRKTHGGISEVLKLYERNQMWEKYHCRWIETHRNGSSCLKLWYLFKGLLEYIVYVPFYDIVHIHFSLPSSAKRKYTFFKIAKALRKKIVIHLHCGSQINNIWNPYYQKMFENCDCGIVLSDILKQIIEKRIENPEKLEVVYNPCPIIATGTKYDKKNQILFSGLLVENKGYKDLIRAFAKIAHQHPDWSVVLAGSGELEQAMSLAKELGITEQVELPGWINGEEKDVAFCEAKAFCLPSYAEGFPMAVLDAWAYGLPVITTPVGGIPDVAEDGKNMLLFNPGDIDTLTDCLERMISDEGLRARLTDESVRLASTTFNIDTISHQIGMVYEELIGS